MNVRQKMHEVIGHMRRHEIIQAYELICKISGQLDDEYYLMRFPHVPLEEQIDGITEIQERHRIKKNADDLEDEK